MNALNFHQTELSPTMQWWNALSVKQKNRLSDKHFPFLNPFLLTHTDIEVIFKKETHG